MKNLILCLLLLLLGQEKLHSQSFLTKGDVYDYAIGDEFHYHLSRVWMIEEDYIHRVLNKYTTATHLYYEMGKVDRSNTTVILSTFLDSIPLASLTNAVLDTASTWGFADTICTSTDSIVINTSFLGLEHQVFSFTINAPDNYEPPFWSNRFAKGLGEVTYRNTAQNGYLNIDLVYFKKGLVEWGSDVYINSTSTLEQQSHLTVFPNPFTNHLYLEIDGVISNTLTVELYNNVGQLVLQKELVPAEKTLLLPIPPQLPSGIYHAVVRWDNQQQVLKITKT